MTGLEILRWVGGILGSISLVLSLCSLWVSVVRNRRLFNENQVLRLACDAQRRELDVLWELLKAKDESGS